MDNNEQPIVNIQDSESDYKKWKKTHRVLGWGIVIGYPIVMAAFTMLMYSFGPHHIPNIQPIFALISALICLLIFISESMLAIYKRDKETPYLIAAIVAIVPLLVAFAFTVPNMLEGNFGVYRAIFGEHLLTTDIPLIGILILAVANIKKAKK